MSAPAVMVALKVVSTVYAMQTAVQGLAEGNLAKAVIGGVAAYFGASGLGTTASSAASGSTAASESAASLSTEAGDAAAANSMSGGVSDVGVSAANQAGASASSAPSATTGIDGASATGIEGASTNNGMWTLEDGMAGRAVPGGVAESNLGPVGYSGLGIESGGGGEGLLSQFGDWANKNQTLANGMMQFGGNVLTGYAQGEMAQKQIDEIRRQERQRRADEDARRRRIGAQGDIGFLRRYSYNPATGTME